MSQQVSLISDLATFRAHDRQTQLDRMPYGEYLQTPEWVAIRSGKLEEAGYTCEECQRPAAWVECHHLRYPARRGTETNKDLLAVCPPCHREIHGVKR